MKSKNLTAAVYNENIAPMGGGKFEKVLNLRERMNLNVSGAILPLGYMFLSTGAKIVWRLLNPLRRTRWWLCWFVSKDDYVDLLVILTTTVSTSTSRCGNSFRAMGVAILHQYKPRCWYSCRQKIMWRWDFQKIVQEDIFVPLSQETAKKMYEVFLWLVQGLSRWITKHSHRSSLLCLIFSTVTNCSEHAQLDVTLFDMNAPCLCGHRTGASSSCPPPLSNLGLIRFLSLFFFFFFNLVRYNLDLFY